MGVMVEVGSLFLYQNELMEVAAINELIAVCKHVSGQGNNIEIALGEVHILVDKFSSS